MKFDNPSRKFNEYFAINQLHNSENTVPNLTDMTDGRTDGSDRKNSRRICKKILFKSENALYLSGEDNML